MNPSVSIVIPIYNEENRISKTLEELKHFVEAQSFKIEIILVAEKSTDGTVGIIEKSIQNKPYFLLIKSPVQKGKGYAVKAGMLRARGEVSFFMDADLSTPLNEVSNFMNIFKTSELIDIVVGSRAERKSQISIRQSWLRQSLGKCFNFFVQLIGIPGIKDTQCGFKAFRKNSIYPIFRKQTMDGFAFDVEILLLAQKLGYKIYVAPVSWANSPGSKVRIWIDPILMFWDLIRVRKIVKTTIQNNKVETAPSEKPQKAA